MISFTQGNIFSADCEGIVIPVNVMGIMGEGLVKTFKNKYHDASKAYMNKCRNEEIITGKISYTLLPPPFKYALFFPTKHHWKKPSKMQWIKKGLVSLDQTSVELGLHTIAVPALGCELGGLDWKKVRLQISRKLAGSKCEYVVYEPQELQDT